MLEVPRCVLSRSTSTIFLAIVTLSLLCAISSTAASNLSLIPWKVYGGGSQTPHIWTFVTSHFFDTHLLRLSLFLPILLGLCHDLEPFLGAASLWLLLFVAGAVSGTLVFFVKIIVWVTVQNEEIFFTPSANIFSLLGAIVVAFVQSHLPSPVAAAPFLPFTSSTSSVSVLPPCPVDAPPILLAYPKCRYLSSSSSDPFHISDLFTKLACSFSAIDLTTFLHHLFLPWRRSSGLFSSSIPSGRPAIPRVTLLIWLYPLFISIAALITALCRWYQMASFVPEVFSLAIDPTCLLYAISGSSAAWIYLRYFAFFGVTGSRGDPSVEFSFALVFCPSVVAPYVTHLTSTFSKLFPSNARRTNDPAASPTLPPRRRNMGCSAALPTFNFNTSTLPLTETQQALKAKGVQILEKHIQRREKEATPPPSPPREISLPPLHDSNEMKDSRNSEEIKFVDDEAHSAPLETSSWNSATKDDDNESDDFRLKQRQNSFDV